jgi:hypothetical protein
VKDVGDSDQVPFDTVNSCDTVAVPVTAGATEFTGKPTTAAVDADHLPTEPFAFVAVTAATMNLVASDDVSV